MSTQQNSGRNLEEAKTEAVKMDDLAAEAQELTPEQAEGAKGGFSWGAHQLGTSSYRTTGAGGGKVSMQD